MKDETYTELAFRLGAMSTDQLFDEAASRGLETDASASSDDLRALILSST